MRNRSSDETALLSRAQNGDADAFGELYLLHLDQIYRYVYFRLGHASDAEDLTEQVFLKAWEALPTYRIGPTPFLSWLYRIAHNTLADYHRRQQPVTPMSTQQHPDLASPLAPALDQVIEAEEAAALAAAIAQLPEEHQQVILLRFIEGMNHAEVARMLDKSEGACRVIQHRALATLHQLLNGPTRQAGKR